MLSAFPNMTSEPAFPADDGQPSSPRRVGRATLVGLLLLSLFISMTFFWEGRTATVSSLSGDQINILTVCIKRDQPSLLQQDMIVGDPRNVAYYTPWFVDTVRWFSGQEHDYYKGLNRLLFLTSLVYFWGWWLLFSRWGNPIVAGLLAFLARGIMWPPGNELWGIAGLWTMLPRTLFLAAVPWVLWLWLLGRRSVWSWALACLGCGLLANLHPISGATLAVGFLLAEFAVSWQQWGSLRKALVRTLVAMLLVFAGMLPFVLTYLSGVGTTAGIDPAEYTQALHMRINKLFFDPWLYIGKWFRPKWIAITWLPWVALLFLRKEELRPIRPVLTLMAAIVVGCLSIILLPFQLEKVLGHLGIHTPIAFQFIRGGKYLLIPSFVITSIVISALCRRLEIRVQRPGRLWLCVLAGGLGVTLAARLPVFDNVPFLGDDVCRMLWPFTTYQDEKARHSLQGLETVSKWIRENTDSDAKFVGPREIRIAACRPVIHDWSGAGMLIEGNPKAFIEAARREKALEAAQKDDPEAIPELVASWGADFWVTDTVVHGVKIAYENQGCIVYDLRKRD